MGSWKRIEPTVNSKIGWRSIITKTFKMPDGVIKHFQTISPEGSTAIATIALTPDNKVILARQFRVGPEEFMDELPGGGREQGETLEGAAIRELAEETGYTPGNIEYLGKVYKDAYQNTAWHFFFATDCVKCDAGQRLDDSEHVEVVLINIADLFANARNAKMTDVEAVFLAYERLKELEGK